MRNVLVTGGSRGLGLTIAETLAAAGFRVIALARQEGETLANIRRSRQAQDPGALDFNAFDLTELDKIPDLVKALRREFGTFYGLVNNAGIGTPGILPNMADRDIALLLRLNVQAPMLLTKYLLRSMMSAREGRIVNMSSVVAATGYSGLSAYAASKAAMSGFTRSLAREMGPLGITVNAVAPGFIDTEMTGGLTEVDRTKIARRSALGRLADSSDVAAAVAFLFSDAARNITGTIMTVDAGNTA